MRKITIFLPITREWRLEAMGDMIGKLDKTNIDLDIVVVVDNSQITESMVRTAFNEKVQIEYIHEMHRLPPSEHNVYNRRQRIVDVHNTAKQFIPDDTELVFGLEDDTNIQPDSLQKLVSAYDKLISQSVKVGIVSGVQAGRWGIKMIGAWRVNDVNNMTIAETIPFNFNKIYEKVDATGLYCYITPTELFKSSTFKSGHFGADVFYGIDVRRQGYENFITWLVPCGHALKTKELLVDNKCRVVQYECIDGTWKLQKGRNKNANHSRKRIS